MENIQCRFNSFNGLIKLHDRNNNNPDVCNYKVHKKIMKRYQRFLNLMEIYNNSKEDNKLVLFNKFLIE